jgi:predicted amino acid dehydrogenase
MDIPLDGACAAVVGATGAIGRACATLLSHSVGELILIARRQNDLEIFKEELMAGSCRARLRISTDINALQDAQLIVTVTSAVHAVIEAEVLRPGSVICDVARPRDVSVSVATLRDDVLVIDGGMVQVPGLVDFHFNFGFPPQKAYACMAETIALALEGRFEDYTIGKEINLERVEEITRIASNHGFKLSGFRSFEKAVTPEDIERVRQNARRRVRQS